MGKIRRQKIFWKLITPLPGKSEVEINSAQARLMLRSLLDSVEYEVPLELKSSERLNLLINTARSLANGYRQWQQGQEQPVLDVWPAQEFYRAEWREKNRDWFERWKAAGGQIFPFTGKESYPTASDYKGRMIALKNDPIWETISAFGLPFRPFDFLSGMDIRDVKRSEAIALGLIQSQQRIQSVILLASDEFRQRLEIKLQQNLDKLIDEAEES